MRHGISRALTSILVGVLLACVFVQVWVLPSAVVGVVTAFPEVDRLAVPAVVWGVITIACWQAVVVIGLRLVVVVRDHGFNSSCYGWLRAIVGCLVAFILLVAAAFIALSVMGYSSPVMLGLIAGGILALIVVVVMVLFLGAHSVVRNQSDDSRPQR